MQFSRNWLSRYTVLPESTAELADLLTGCGLVVEGIDERGAETVFDLEIAGNRVDLMNHLGVAREIAAARRVELRPPESALEESRPPVGELARIDVEDRSGCPRFVARAVTGVTVGPSPAWMAELLLAIGLRPINNVVDVTNFVMWELGHPLHAFDLDLLVDSRLLVRSARPGERLETLDGVVRQLTGEDIVIADGRRLVGLAGIMGGADTEIRDTTTRVLLEGAWWDPLRVRRTSDRLDLHTDAAYRFQRGPAFDGMIAALDRAAALTAEAGGGTLHEGRIDVRQEDRPAPEAELRVERLARLLGIDIEPAEVEDILGRLGFGLRSTDDGFVVTVPSFRGDVRREEDLIEEVARHHGYDRLPDTLPALQAPRRPAAPDVLAERRLKSLCVAAGFFEAMASPLSSAAEQEPFLAAGAEPMAIANPISEKLAVLRAHLVPGLLAATAHNVNRGVSTLRLYEVGHRFAPPYGDREGARERTALAFAAVGSRDADHWSGAEHELDLFELKGTIDAVSGRMGWPPWRWEAAADLPGLSSDAAARLLPDNGPRGDVGGQAAGGWAGRVDTATAHRFGIEVPVWVVEIDVDALLRRPETTPRYRPLPRFPGGSRDLSVLVADDVPYRQVAEALRQVGSDDELPLERMALVDVYRGEDIPEGFHSLTLRFSYRANDRTLTAEEIDAAHRRLTDTLVERFAARPR